MPPDLEDFTENLEKIKGYRGKVLIAIFNKDRCKEQGRRGWVCGRLYQSCELWAGWGWYSYGGGRGGERRENFESKKEEEI